MCVDGLVVLVILVVEPELLQQELETNATAKPQCISTPYCRFESHLLAIRFLRSVFLLLFTLFYHHQSSNKLTVGLHEISTL